MIIMLKYMKSYIQKKVLGLPHPILIFKFYFCIGVGMDIKSTCLHNIKIADIYFQTTIAEKLLQDRQTT